MSWSHDTNIYNSLDQSESHQTVTVPPSYRNETSTPYGSLYNETKIAMIVEHIRMANKTFKFRKDNSPLISKDHKLEFCWIEKNVCSKLKTLFFSLNVNYIKKESEYKNYSFPRYRWDILGDVHDFHFRYACHSQQPYMIRNLNELGNIMHDTNWTRIVVVRDPLERLLSGYLNKCIRREARDGFYKECVHGPKKASFEEFVNTIVTEIKQHKYFEMNAHFSPQICHCMLWKYYNNYDYSIFYKEQTIGDDILQILNDLNLTEYYYHYGEHQNEGLFNKLSIHHTAAGSKLTQYYTKQIAQKVYDAFWIDYAFFNLSKPKWIDSL